MKISKPTFSIILFKSKVLASGEHPIMIRATYAGKRRYYSLGYSASSANWSDSLGRFDKGKKRLTEEERKANLQLDKSWATLNSLTEYFNNVDFTFSRFERKMFNASNGNVWEFTEEVIKDLEAQERLGSAKAYKDTLARLKEFKKSNITFYDIDIRFLQQFEQKLKKTNSPATIGIYLRTLRAIFNRAIKDGLVSSDAYPFNEFKIKSPPSRKKALTKDHIKLLKDYKPKKGSNEKESVNLFLFSYYARGMNLTDIANLKWSNIRQGRIFYTRQKSNDQIDILIDENLSPTLASYYSEGDNEFILNILEKGLSAKTIRYRIHAKLKVINKDLQTIAKQIGLPDDITFYWARHTYATVLKRAGVSISVIQETLGHSSEQVTKNYLDSFETSQLDKISELL